MLKLTALLLLVVSLVYASGGTIQPTEKSEWLDAHNEHRKAQPASDMQEMVWSAPLAKLAADYAVACKWSHRPRSERKDVDVYAYVGENLSWNSRREAIASVIKGWVSEIKDYDYTSGKCSGVCGHYTQVVWAKTCAVGCAIAFCPKFEAYDMDAYYTVCNYGPGGNIGGEKPFMKGPGGLTESQCTADKGNQTATTTSKPTVTTPQPTSTTTKTTTATTTSETTTKLTTTTEPSTTTAQSTTTKVVTATSGKQLTTTPTKVSTQPTTTEKTTTTMQATHEPCTATTPRPQTTEATTHRPSPTRILRCRRFGCRRPNPLRRPHRPAKPSRNRRIHHLMRMNHQKRGH